MERHGDRGTRQHHISDATAARYATDDQPKWRLLAIHDYHLHRVGSAVEVTMPCPSCPYCKCPVPANEHIPNMEE